MGGIGARRAKIKATRSPVFDVCYAGADGLDDPGAFQSERQRQVALVEPAAQLSVEQIDAGGLDLDQNLARPGHRQRQLLELQRFGSAMGVNADRLQAAQRLPQNVNSTASGVALK